MGLADHSVPVDSSKEQLRWHGRLIANRTALLATSIVGARRAHGDRYPVSQSRDKLEVRNTDRCWHPRRQVRARRAQRIAKKSTVAAKSTGRTIQVSDTHVDSSYTLFLENAGLRPEARVGASFGFIISRLSWEKVLPRARTWREAQVARQRARRRAPDALWVAAEAEWRADEASLAAACRHARFDAPSKPVSFSYRSHPVEGAADPFRSRLRCGPRLIHSGLRSSDLDASLLLMPQVGFLPMTDERVRRAVGAIERELVAPRPRLGWPPDSAR